MNEHSIFQREPFEVDPEVQGISRSGHWFRIGPNIVVPLDDKTQTGNSEIHEVPTGGIPSRKDLIDSRIDFYAQEALYRMFKGDPSAREDASGMFVAVKAGQLAGIYIVNQGVPALRARKMNTWFWKLIPDGEDAILLLDPANPITGPPLIAFRDSVKSVPSRLDPALRRAWKTFQLVQTKQLVQCDRPSLNGPSIPGVSLETQPYQDVPLSNLVPPILCEAPQQVPPIQLPPLDTVRPGETFCSGGLDVRQVNDAHIPQKIKTELYYNPGKIISKHLPIDPTKLNPNYPSGRVIVIPVETLDHPRNPNVTTAYIANIFFSASSKAVSVKNYFSENSWGQFQPTNGGISDWVKLPKRLADYGPTEGGVNLLRTILNAANINWAPLDVNNDATLTRGEVTIVILIPNGDSTLKKAGQFASTRHVFAPNVRTPNGIFTFSLPIIYFSLVEAADPDPVTNPIRALSTMCHELCHAFFDLTDRYGPTTGTGPYDIMSNDRFFEHMNIHDKMKIGWIQPKIVRGHLGRCLAFQASESINAALILMSPETPQTPLKSDEYWIVENRNKAFSGGDFDAGLPESGLAVWWVKTAGFPNGHDDVRLVNFSMPDQNPMLYQNPVSSALFNRNDVNPMRQLLDGKGRRTFAWFRGISPAGPTMNGEF